MLSAIRRTIEILTTVLGVFAGIGLLYLIFGTALDILLRHATGRGFPAIIEYAEVVMVVMVYFSLAQTQRNDGHVASEMVAQHLPTRMRTTLEALGLAWVSAVLILVIVQAAEIAWDSYQRGEYRLGLSRAIVWPARIAIVVGLAALLGQIVVRVFGLLIVASRRIPLSEVDGEEPKSGGGKYL